MTSDLRRAVIKFLIKLSSENYGTQLTVGEIYDQSHTLFDAIWFSNAIMSGPKYGKLHNIDYYDLVHYYNMANLSNLNSPTVSVVKDLAPHYLYTMSKYMRALNGVILHYIIILFATKDAGVLFSNSLIEAIEILANSDSAELIKVVNCNLIKSDLWYSHISPDSSISEILELSSDFYECKDSMFEEYGYEGSSAVSVIGSLSNLTAFEYIKTLFETKGL